MSSESLYPWFSIIVPIYNAEKYLDNCIQSVLKNTFNNYELLLVDDGSTDHSSNTCKKYSHIDERVHYFYKSNGGPLETRVYGMERCKGRYIMFLDGDDQYKNKNAS